MRAKGACLLMLLLLVVLPRVASAADLQVTDSRGTKVTLKNAGIDYGSFLGSQKETRGIRVQQGDGVVFLLWDNVVSVTVVHRDENVKPPRVELEVVLKNGKKVPAELFRQGNMKLVGTSDLGEYSIDLDKVRSITLAPRSLPQP